MRSLASRYWNAVMEEMRTASPSAMEGFFRSFPMSKTVNARKTGKGAQRSVLRPRGQKLFHSICGFLVHMISTKHVESQKAPIARTRTPRRSWLRANCALDSEFERNVPVQLR